MEKACGTVDSHIPGVAGVPTTGDVQYGGSVSQTGGVPIVTESNKDRGLAQAYILGIPFGWLGAHHFYLRRPGWGVLYLFTLGLFGVGYVVDLFRMPFLVRAANKDRQLRHDPDVIQNKSVADAYLLWFPCGLFGAHHFYLRNIGWGFAYLFTMGFLGMGWLIDGICMCSMVSSYNERLAAKHIIQQQKQQQHQQHQQQQPVTVIPSEVIPSQRYLVTAYRLCLFPVTGLLGAHHYYLGRIAYGLFYTFTLGGLGLSWFADWFRLPILVKDANKRRQDHRGFRERRLDDCYLAAIPCGLFGAHHFYLRNVGWGFLYLFTMGCFGIGWLIDLIRMPRLLKQHREDMKKRLIDNAGESGTGGTSDYGTHQVVPPSGPGGGQQYMGPGVSVISPEHVVPGYPGHFLPAPGVVPQGTITTPAYPNKMDGQAGMPPQYIPPPGYDESGMSSFSTIASSNVNGPPSYQDALMDSRQNQSNMATESSPATAPPLDP